MKVLLVSSNLYAQFPGCFPNASAALSAYLKERGHTVRIVHLARRREQRRLPRLMAEFAPDVVGATAITCEAPAMIETSRIAKAWRDVPVVCGGTHVIVDPESILNLPTVDAICHGEGEEAFAEYLDKLAGGQDVTDVKGFWFKKDGQVVRNPPRPFIKDLDSLPFPDRTQGDQQRAIDSNNGVLNILLGRGCNSVCRFCCNGNIRQANTGTYVRNKSVARSIEELRRVHEAFKFRWITIRDDNFPWDKKWALEFCEEYPKHFQTPFEVFARVDGLTEPIMDALKAAGCYSIFVGLDSGNDFIRNEVLHKRQTNEDLLKAVAYMKKIGLQPIVSNIVGLPYETLERHRDTVEINKKVYADRVVFSPSFGATPKIWVFDPWPGTELQKICRDEGWLPSEERQHKTYRQSCLDMPQFSRVEVHRAFRRFRYDVYKDNFPLHAWLFRLYDTRLVEEVMEHIPLNFIGDVRQAVLLLMSKAVRRFTATRSRFDPVAEAEPSRASTADKK
jgi:radical SAM superfamily enzyme YgiQ (UPF0313 family)